MIIEGGVYGDIGFVWMVSEICNFDGSIVFQNDVVEILQGWLQVVLDVIVQKYFCWVGVLVWLKWVKEKGVFEFLWCLVVDYEVFVGLFEDQWFGVESLVWQVFD